MILKNNSKKNKEHSHKQKNYLIQDVLTEQKNRLPKPEWIKIKLPIDSEYIQNIKTLLRKNTLHSICEETNCPNLTECFKQGTATFVILGTTCTRKCPFCNISSGRPKSPDQDEPKNLADTIRKMKLHYVVITSVNRDDLQDGGGEHFAKCIQEIRKKNPLTKIEILVPDFRGRIKSALKFLNEVPPDVFNHNLENIPRLYSKIRPGANYKNSLFLLKSFKKTNPKIPTKSGLILGLGETQTEIIKVMNDLYSTGVSILTIGQYLQPTPNHLPVQRYITPIEFQEIKKIALNIGFNYVASGPFVRSSYHAELQTKGIEIK